MAELPSVATLRSLLRYDGNTGLLFWRERPASRFKPCGKRAAEAAALRERVAELEGALKTVVDALVKHHQWHAAQTDPDPEHGFIPANEYADSSLYDLTTEALWVAQKATGPHNFAALKEPKP